MEGNKVCTKSKKNNPFVESFRAMGASCTRDSCRPSEVTSLGVAATNLMNDVKIIDIFFNSAYCECDGVDLSLSSDLGDTWYHGPPISPRWAGGLELGTDDHRENTAEKE